MFCRLSVLLLVSLIASPPVVDAQEQQIYELRTFRNSDAAKGEAVVKYVEAALLPALHRYGISSVGVFQPTPKEGEQVAADVYVLIPFASMESFASLRPALQADKEYLAASAAFMSASRKDPAFTRIDSRLMKAFAGMPQLEVPSKESTDRILELRIYESHTQDKARLKVEMFNDGEIEIMKDVKLGPVFFGESLISNDLPNLTYMLSADNAAVHKEHFQDFLKHPKWDVMKRMEKYKGTVSKITSVLLKPAACSGI